MPIQERPPWTANDPVHVSVPIYAGVVTSDRPIPERHDLGPPVGHSHVEDSRPELTGTPTRRQIGWKPGSQRGIYCLTRRRQVVKTSQLGLQEVGRLFKPVSAALS